jgi:hypothetical protein
MSTYTQAGDTHFLPLKLADAVLINSIFLDDNITANIREGE